MIRNAWQWHLSKALDQDKLLQTKKKLNFPFMYLLIGLQNSSEYYIKHIPIFFYILELEQC